MASINYATREISCKIVYYGPGLSGKTTNLQIIHRKIPDKDKSEMVSLATETDRTLFFDFLPLDLGSIKGFSTKFQLYTVPGQVYYNATRKLVLRGVDGVVFVVDSQIDKLQENLESFANLQENLREYGHSIENIPLVLQYNKRDLPNVYQVDQLNALINKYKLPHYEAVAATGVGVFTTLKGIGKSVIDKFNAKYAGFQGTRRPARPGDAAPAGSTPAPQPKAPAAPPAPPRPASSSPQPFPGPGAFGAPAAAGFGGANAGFGGPTPQAPAPRPADPGFRSPLNVPGPQPQSPTGGGFVPASNPFAGNTGFPTSVGFPGAAQVPPQPAPISGPAPSGGFGGPAGGGFGTPPGNPFGGGAGNGPTGFGGPGAPMAPPAKPAFPNPFSSPASPGAPMGNMPGTGAAPSPFPFAAPKPVFPEAPKPMGQPGLTPQNLGGQGFNPPPAGIPISPFVEGFASPKPAAAPNPSASSANLSAPPLQPFGQNKPMAPMGNPLSGSGYPPGMPAMPGMPNNPPGLQPMPGGPPSGGFGSPPGGFPGMGSQPGPSFGSPPGPAGQGPAGQGPGPGFPGGFGNPGSPAGAPPQNSPFPPVNKGQSPFPTLAMPVTQSPMEPQAGQNPGGGNGGIVDNSGIVSTFEDIAKDDSFKTKKLPHPSEKKKGFFDGLFKKEK